MPWARILTRSQAFCSSKIVSGRAGHTGPRRLCTGSGSPPLFPLPLPRAFCCLEPCGRGGTGGLHTRRTCGDQGVKASPIHLPLAPCPGTMTSKERGRGGVPCQSRMSGCAGGWTRCTIASTARASSWKISSPPPRSSAAACRSCGRRGPTPHARRARLPPHPDTMPDGRPEPNPGRNTTPRPAFPPRAVSRPR